MNFQARELWNFWNEIKNKQEVKLIDIDKLEKYIGNLLQKMDEIEKSKEKWKERALRKK